MASYSYYLGQIILWTNNVRTPDDFVECDGRSYSIQQFTALYSVIGQAFGGSGSSFNVPDLRGAMPIGWDSTKPFASRNVPFNSASSNDGTVSVPVAASSLPQLTAQTLAAQVPLPLKATLSSGQNTPQDKAVLGAGGAGAASATIYVPPGGTGTIVALDGGALTIPSQGLIVNAGGSGTLSIKVPALAIRFLICTVGLYPTFS